MQADKKEGGEGEYEGRMKWGRNRRGARIEIRRPGKKGKRRSKEGKKKGNQNKEGKNKNENKSVEGGMGIGRLC